ncbi:hypothetical protein B194_4152 [Serratia plymuthica A30]|nr:hypothetical protein B194_4152 [Serratia plymuthica A30]
MQTFHLTGAKTNDVFRCETNGFSFQQETSISFQMALKRAEVPRYALWVYHLA